MSQQSPTKYFFPAEWHRQKAIQLTWPHEATDWRPYLEAINGTFVALAREITMREELIVATPHPSEVKELLADKLGETAMERVNIQACPTNDTWARDHGALTLLPRNGEGEPLLLDYKFNGWGEKFPWQLDNAISSRLFAQGALKGQMHNCNDFVLEGGSIETNGKGTLLTTSCCLLAPHRNQPMTQTQIEQRLKDDFCVDRVLWLDHGHLDGDDTDGHIDTLVRFAPNDTLLYMGCDDTADSQYGELKTMEEQLRSMRTKDGKTYRLLKLPTPHPIYYDGERLPATYANFVVLNGAILVPTYAQTDLDQEAMRLIGEAFPGREVVGIDSRTVIRQHGSLHCLTMQYPAQEAID
jgi:agmatine/peptidylarginine deiminase